ncbi:MAG: GGDEF domain-containing protein [Thermomicrobiales bacterium]
MTRLARSLTGGGKGFAVLFIDLDGFKEVNDLLGHRAGDRILINASARMRNELRTNDFLARLGGDEFVAILWDVPTPEGAEDVGRRIIGSLKAPFSDAPTSVNLAASVGIAIAVPGVDTPDGVLHRADGAMYDAKRSGKGRVRTASADEARRELADLLTG